jgi:DNA mismatch endonuclease (patch repair protein)
MRSIRQKNTREELAVRSLLHRLGYRFRLHARKLPGRPDIVLPRLRKAIFVHGCFWHQHVGCRGGRAPSSRTEYWVPKLAANRERDARKEAALRAVGWSVLVVWQCELKDTERLQRTLLSFLSEPR